MLLSGSAGFPETISVTALALYLKTILEKDDQLQYVWVHGEVSNCKTYPSGHCYFTLKEGEAQLACVFFKHARLRTSAPVLRDGMALAVCGRVSFYERDGRLQFYVEEVMALGEGALYQRFERLKAQLAAEGLFDPERKRSLPTHPAVIGIVTSLQAAALRDMVRVLRQRYPLGRVLLSPSLVQGAEAPASIAAALDLLNTQGEADVIIVGRGGGSIEELWAFNDELVARAIARSRIPVISGVGHETDFTIADFVADHRASTPTAAATVAVPDIADLYSKLSTREQDLQALISQRLLDAREELAHADTQLQRLSPQSFIQQQRLQLEQRSDYLQEQMRHRITLHQERLRGLSLQLHSLSPLLTLARGYAVVRHQERQQVVTSVQQVQPGNQLTVQVQDGMIPVVVRSADEI